ncbi:hypothetical protein [Actinomyces sp. oral taxon 170]|uniref:hypothetical protein n=1 Tax=Actinomyces sp. oral taxon 170 TaxID=712117 RepID=UPI00209E0D87|nr:hypothetical protein [Actinomyces sp. oral taxon 170]
MTGWVDDGDGAAVHRMHRAWLRFIVAALKCRAVRLAASSLTARRDQALRRLLATLRSGHPLASLSPTSAPSSSRLQTGLQRRWWDDGVAIFIHRWIDEDALEEHLVEQLLQAIRHRQVQPVAVLQEIERLGEVLLHQSSIGRVTV